MKDILQEGEFTTEDDWLWWDPTVTWLHYKGDQWGKHSRKQM